VHVHVLAPVREPQRDLERRVAERARERGGDPLRGSSLQLDDEARHVQPREARPEQAGDQRDRHGRDADDLPPEEVVEHPDGRRSRERDQGVEDRPERGHDRGQQHRQQHAAHPRRRCRELAHRERDEDRRQAAVGGDRIHVLQRADDVLVPGEVEEALARVTVVVAESMLAVVGRQHRQREDEHDRVGDVEEQSLQAVRDAAGGIRERGMGEERVAELARGGRTS
jgi:hypothetical protein